MNKILSYLPWIIVTINLIVSVSIKFNDLAHVQKSQERTEIKLMEICERVSCLEGYNKLRGK